MRSTRSAGVKCLIVQKGQCTIGTVDCKKFFRAWKDSSGTVDFTSRTRSEILVSRSWGRFSRPCILIEEWILSMRRIRHEKQQMPPCPVWSPFVQFRWSSVNLVTRQS